MKRVKVGDKFSRLTISERVSPIGDRNTRWLCTCVCGRTTVTSTVHLNSGHTTSCGCYRDERARAAAVTHGQSGSPTYNSWAAMKQRCYYEKNDNFEYYGGRGIKVCDRWLNSFENFLADMGQRPEGLTLEREDVNLDYSPSNCIWETNSRQGYNTNQFSTNTSGRTGVYLEPKGLWRALIGVDNELLYLGSYVTIEEAIAVREAAELKYYGFNKE